MKSQDIFSAEAAKGWLPWGAFAPVLGLLFLIASDVVGGPVLERLVRLDATGLPVDMAGLIGLLIILFVPLLAIVLLWVRWVERRSIASIGWVGPNKLRRFLYGHLIGMASILAIVGVMWLTGGLAMAPETTSAATATSFAPAWSSAKTLMYMLVLLASFALQASTEEILFRGWLLSVVAKKFNTPLAVVLSSALFTFAHLSRDQYWLTTVGTFLFALFCCVWVLRTRNLFGVMGWHAGWNWLLAVGFGLPVTGIDVGIPALLVKLTPVGADWLTGGSEGPEASVVCLGYFVLATTALWFLRKNVRAPVEAH